MTGSGPPGSTSDSTRRRPRAAPPPSLWRFGRDGAAIIVRNAEAVLAHLPLFLAGWPLEWAGPDTTGAAVDIDVTEHAGTIDVVALASNHCIASAGTMDAANALAGALVGAFIARHPRMICLHAGSVAIDGRLAVLIGASHAGKSSVALQLAAAGHRLFGDDRIALRTGGEDTGDGDRVDGLCLGLMPKLRLPLPPGCGARFEEFVDGYTELRDDSAVYLKPWEGEAASFGETAPFGALVVLERVDGAPATVERLDRATLLRAAIENATAPHLSAEQLVRRLGALAQRISGWRLRFGSSRDAAEALVSALRAAEGGSHGRA
jgi:hypothetical protein